MHITSKYPLDNADHYVQTYQNANKITRSEVASLHTILQKRGIKICQIIEKNTRTSRVKKEKEKKRIKNNCTNKKQATARKGIAHHIRSSLLLTWIQFSHKDCRAIKSLLQ